MIDYNSAIAPSGSADRAALQQAADMILANVDGEVPPVEVEPDRAGRERLRVWSTDLLQHLGVEPGAVRFTRAGLRLRTDDEITEYGTDGLEELLDQFPGLTPLEKAVAFHVLDGREQGRGYMTDVAEAVDITPGSARVHWSNAKRKMRAKLEAKAS